KALNGAWLMPSTAFGQVVASHGTSLPLARSRMLGEPGMTTAPTMFLTLEVAGSRGRVPMSPQSMFRAQRPEVMSPRPVPWSRLISAGGPNSDDAFQKSSAEPMASLLTSGVMLSPKNVPCLVPSVWTKQDETALNCPVPTPPLAFSMHEP